jgi:hypothetical protein
MKIKPFYCLAIILDLFLFSNNTRAQSIENDKGTMIVKKSYVDIEGSPFLTDDFNKGTIKLSNGVTYKDTPLKYDQVEDVVYFQGKDGQTLMFAQPVNEFTISYIKDNTVYNKHYRNNYPPIAKNTDKSFYEILTDGTAQLLKRTIKSIQEDKPYNSATITRNINEDVKYYLFISGKINQIKKDKKSVFSVLGNKQDELEKYMKTNNINLKNDEDLAKLLAYYNSL